MHPLEDRRRRALLSASALLCTSCLLLLPIAARSSRAVFSERSGAGRDLAALQLRAAAPVTVPHLRRDPFAADRGASATDSAQMAPSPIVGMRVVQGESTGYAVPAAGGTILRAIVRGSGGARALVESSGRATIVSAGDTLGDSRIVRIDADGVRLANGTQLRVESGTP